MEKRPTGQGHFDRIRHRGHFLSGLPMRRHPLPANTSVCRAASLRLLLASILLCSGAALIGKCFPAVAWAQDVRAQGTSAGIGSGAESEDVGLLHQRFFRWLFEPIITAFPPEEKRQDLGFSNFFSYGWTQGWAEPEEGPDDAPRFRLLRIQRAFWERELRTTYNYTFGADSVSKDEQEVEFELELPLSRRFLIEFEGGLVGLKEDGESWDFRGGDLKITPEVMLVETHDVSFSTGLFIRTPTGSNNLGEGRTSLMPYLAFWKDLGHRIGLHSYLGSDFPLGGFGPGAPDVVFQYGLAPTITVTAKATSYFGNLTFFVEVNGETSTGGKDDGTTLTLLPGARWLVYKDVWLACGYEFPLTGTDKLDGRVWASLYLDF